jgi:CDGSH-type Zn-finger protein/uncharacterized Fe-S cluster protein YjdI
MIDARHRCYPAVMSAPESVRGKQLTIHFDGARCVHSRSCVIDAPQVFKANVVGAWIDPDAMPAEELMAVARSCPSGAITYDRHDGGPGERAPEVNTARVRENGPLAIHAALTIGGHGDCLRATLCRCGASNNKPFCDGSHVAAGFSATGEPTTRDVTALAARDGVLTVNPAPHGPLLVTGHLELLSGTGRVVERTDKCALCRCGQSSNKPFCDGTHRTIGFVAP